MVAHSGAQAHVILYGVVVIALSLKYQGVFARVRR